MKIYIPDKMTFLDHIYLPYVKGRQYMIDGRGVPHIFEVKGCTVCITSVEYLINKG
jgi:hypothetical protein